MSTSSLSFQARLENTSIYSKTKVNNTQKITASYSVAGLPCSDESQSLQPHCPSPLPPQSPSLPSLFLFFISSHFFSLPSPQVQDYTHNRWYQLINVQFSKEALETILDGLGKIRDQLSSVACRCGLTRIIFYYKYQRGGKVELKNENKLILSH